MGGPAGSFCRLDSILLFYQFIILFRLSSFLYSFSLTSAPVELSFLISPEIKYRPHSCPVSGSVLVRVGVRSLCFFVDVNNRHFLFSRRKVPITAEVGLLLRGMGIRYKMYKIKSRGWRRRKAPPPRARLRSPVRCGLEELRFLTPFFFVDIIESVSLLFSTLISFSYIPQLADAAPSTQRG